jgi:hypothetical protein
MLLSAFNSLSFSFDLSSEGDQPTQYRQLAFKVRGRLMWEMHMQRDALKSSLRVSLECLPASGMQRLLVMQPLLQLTRIPQIFYLLQESASLIEPILCDDIQRSPQSLLEEIEDVAVLSGYAYPWSWFPVEDFLAHYRQLQSSCGS